MVRVRVTEEEEEEKEEWGVEKWRGVQPMVRVTETASWELRLTSLSPPVVRRGTWGHGLARNPSTW